VAVSPAASKKAPAAMTSLLPDTKYVVLSLISFCKRTSVDLWQGGGRKDSYLHFSCILAYLTMILTELFSQKYKIWAGNHLHFGGNCVKH